MLSLDWIVFFAGKKPRPHQTAARELLGRPGVAPIFSHWTTLVLGSDRRRNDLLEGLPGDGGCSRDRPSEEHIPQIHNERSVLPSLHLVACSIVSLKR